MAKMKQMKAMQSELSTYQAQVGDYRDGIDRLTRELQEVKKRHFDQKKREQVTQDFQRGDAKVIHPRPVPQVRFTGGGFNLASARKARWCSAVSWARARAWAPPPPPATRRSWRSSPA